MYFLYINILSIDYSTSLHSIQHITKKKKKTLIKIKEVTVRY